MNNHRHVGRPPLRSYLTAGMEATRKGKACAVVMDAQYNVMFNWWQITNGWLNANETRDAASVHCGYASFAFNHRKYCINLRMWSKIHKLRRGTNSINDPMANRVIIHSLVLILRNVIDPLVSSLNLRNQRPLTSHRPPTGLPLRLPRLRSAITVGHRTRVSPSATCHFHMLLQI